MADVIHENVTSSGIDMIVSFCDLGRALRWINLERPTAGLLATGH